MQFAEHLAPSVGLAVAWVWSAGSVGFFRPGALITAIKRLDCAPTGRQRSGSYNQPGSGAKLVPYNSFRVPQSAFVCKPLYLPAEQRASLRLPKSNSHPPIVQPIPRRGPVEAVDRCPLAPLQLAHGTY